MDRSLNISPMHSARPAGCHQTPFRRPAQILCSIAILSAMIRPGCTKATAITDHRQVGLAWPLSHLPRRPECRRKLSSPQHCWHLSQPAHRNRSRLQKSLLSRLTAANTAANLTGRHPGRAPAAALSLPARQTDTCLAITTRAYRCGAIWQKPPEFNHPHGTAGHRRGLGRFCEARC